MQTDPDVRPLLHDERSGRYRAETVVDKGIIDRHGGRLQLLSSTEIEQHGTVFRIFLPFETAQRSEG